MPDQSEITDLENEIAELQRNNAELRDQAGGNGLGAVDPEDTAAALMNIQENDAIIGTLQLRLARLKGESE